MTKSILCSGMPHPPLGNANVCDNCYLILWRSRYARDVKDVGEAEQSRSSDGVSVVTRPRSPQWMLCLTELPISTSVARAGVGNGWLLYISAEMSITPHTYSTPSLGTVKQVGAGHSITPCICRPRFHSELPQRELERDWRSKSLDWEQTAASP